MLLIGEEYLLLKTGVIKPNGEFEMSPQSWLTAGAALILNKLFDDSFNDNHHLRPRKVYCAFLSNFHEMPTVMHTDVECLNYILFASSLIVVRAFCCTAKISFDTAITRNTIDYIINIFNMHMEERNTVFLDCRIYSLIYGEPVVKKFRLSQRLYKN